VKVLPDYEGVQPTSTYWATVAAVVPVLSLSLVIEARAIANNWTVGTPRVYRILQSAAWSFPLVGAWAVELGAFVALRGGAVPGWWVHFSEFIISLALAVVVISPAVEFLVKGNAEIFAALVTAHPYQHARHWRLARNLKRTVAAGLRDVTERIADIDRHLNELDVLRSELETLRSKGSPEVAVLAIEAAVADQRISLMELREEQRLLQVDLEKPDFWVKHDDVLAQLHKRMGDERKKLAERFVKNAMDLNVSPKALPESPASGESESAE
jgi:hypothetical protein